MDPTPMTEEYQEGYRAAEYELNAKLAALEAQVVEYRKALQKIVDTPFISTNDPRIRQAQSLLSTPANSFLFHTKGLPWTTKCFKCGSMIDFNNPVYTEKKTGNAYCADCYNLLSSPSDPDVVCVRREKLAQCREVITAVSTYGIEVPHGRNRELAEKFLELKDQATRLLPELNRLMGEGKG